MRDNRFLLGVIVLFALLLYFLASCNPLAAGWQSAALLHDTAALAETSLSSAAKQKHQECQKTQDYQGCIAPYRSALKHWIDYGRPGVNSALIATVASLQIAERSKGKVDYLSLLKPGVCALAACLAQWGNLIPTSVKQTVAVVTAVAGCEVK